MRTTLDLDRDLLERAKEALGAGSFTEAIERALRQVVASTEATEAWSRLEGSDLSWETERLSSALAKIPTAVLPAEAARDAGAMGSFLRAEGAPIPVPDLLIAATAVWLGLPLLTWDGDYARSRERALASRSPHRGAELWKALVLHSASRGA